MNMDGQEEILKTNDAGTAAITTDEEKSKQHQHREHQHREQYHPKKDDGGDYDIINVDIDNSDSSSGGGDNSFSSSSSSSGGGSRVSDEDDCEEDLNDDYNDDDEKGNGDVVVAGGGGVVGNKNTNKKKKKNNNKKKRRRRIPPSIQTSLSVGSASGLGATTIQIDTSETPRSALIVEGGIIVDDDNDNDNDHRGGAHPKDDDNNGCGGGSGAGGKTIGGGEAAGGAGAGGGGLDAYEILPDDEMSFDDDEDDVDVDDNEMGLVLAAASSMENDDDDDDDDEEEEDLADLNNSVEDSFISEVGGGGDVNVSFDSVVDAVTSLSLDDADDHNDDAGIDKDDTGKGSTDTHDHDEAAASYSSLPLSPSQRSLDRQDDDDDGNKKIKASTSKGHAAQKMMKKMKKKKKKKNKEDAAPSSPTTTENTTTATAAASKNQNRLRFPTFSNINPLSPRPRSSQQRKSVGGSSGRNLNFASSTSSSSSLRKILSPNVVTAAQEGGDGGHGGGDQQLQDGVETDDSDKNAMMVAETPNKQPPTSATAAISTTTRKGNRLLPMFRKASNRNNNNNELVGDNDDHDDSSSSDASSSDESDEESDDDDDDDDEEQQWLDWDTQLFFDNDDEGGNERTKMSDLMRILQHQKEFGNVDDLFATANITPADAASTCDDENEIDNISSRTSDVTLSFLGLPPDVYKYLDLDLVKNIDSLDVTTFAWEHHLFVRGLLQLLAERDMIGVEEDEVRKVGVLRKKHAKSGWRVKYVEVRKGNLTYFADKEHEERRMVHLRKRSCMCRTSNTTSAHTSKEGQNEELVFELIVDGGRRLLWMAKSAEECQGWIKAINQAMIGDTDDVTDDVPLDLALYQNAIDVYRSVRSSMNDVKDRKDCLVAINSLLYSQTSSSALRLPIKWIRENLRSEDDSKKKTGENSGGATERLRSNMREFWTNLSSTSININGYLVESGSLFSGERVIGALSRAILEFDKVEDSQDFEQMFKSLKKARQEDSDSLITEIEAVSFARTILAGALRSVNKDDTLKAVQELFSNTNDVAYVELDKSEPLHVDVSFAGDDFSEDEPRPTEVSGWIETKSKKNNKWKLRYFVVSEGVLSYFQWADPRPYGLRGQIVLRGASIKADGNILLIGHHGKERQLQFEDRTHLLKWKSLILSTDNSIPNSDDFVGSDNASSVNGAGSATNTISTPNDDSTIATNNTSVAQQPPSPSRRRTRSVEELFNPNPKPLKAVREAGAKLKNAADGGVKVIGRAKAHANKAAAQSMKRARNATGAGMKSIRTKTGMLMRGVRANAPGVKRRRPTSDMLMTSTRNIDAYPSGKRGPTVQVVVEWNNVYKVLLKKQKANTDPMDSSHYDSAEVLLIVRVKLYQAFLLSGGSPGRLACGDELLLMEFAKADGVEDIQNEALELPTPL